MPDNLQHLFEQMCAGHIDKWDNLPVFANKDAKHDFGVWSWDENHAIVGESRDVLTIRPYFFKEGRIAIDWDSTPLASSHRLF